MASLSDDDLEGSSLNLPDWTKMAADFAKEDETKATASGSGNRNGGTEKLLFLMAKEMGVIQQVCPFEIHDCFALDSLI